AEPLVQVGIVDDGGLHDFCVSLRHHPRHVAAHPLQLLGLASDTDRRRRGAHRLAGLRHGAALGCRNRSGCTARRDRRGADLRGTCRRGILHVLHRDHAACTRARSTFSFLAIARTAGTALTPPTLPACSVRTSLLLETAPTTVPSSSRSAAPPFLISPPSSDAITLSPLAGAGAPAPFAGCAGA